MPFHITLKTVAAQPILSITTTTAPKEISKAFAEIMPRLSGYIVSKGEKPAGPPISRFLEYREDEVCLEAGVPVQNAIEGEGDIRLSELPAGIVAHTVHTGPYNELMKVYPAIFEWLTTQGKQSAGAPWEVYLTDPGNEPDPKKWQTEVNWPVK